MAIVSMATILKLGNLTGVFLSYKEKDEYPSPPLSNVPVPQRRVPSPVSVSGGAGLRC